MYRTDPDRPHAYYDLTKDAEDLLEGPDVDMSKQFTQIRHWPAYKSQAADAGMKKQPMETVKEENDEDN